MLMKVMVQSSWDGAKGEGVNCIHGDLGVWDKAKHIQEFMGEGKKCREK